MRHILTDADGRLLDLQVQTASLQDREEANPAQCTSRRRWNFADVEFADRASAGRLVDWAKESADLALSIVKRPRAMLRFEPLPRRWLVERACPWLIKSRRRVRDFEPRTDVAETLIRIAATATMLRRVASKKWASCTGSEYPCVM